MKRPLLLVLCLPALIGCNDAVTSDSCEVLPYAETGPHVVGIMETAWDEAPVEVWYPAAAASGQPAAYDMRNWLPEETREAIPLASPTSFTMNAYRGAAALPGSYPIVLFSHGFGGYRLQSSFLMTHLASWGFIVIAPEHPERNITSVLAMGEIGDDSSRQLRGALDAFLAGELPGLTELAGYAQPTNIFVSGHSAGGAPVQNLVDDSDLNVRAWAGMATIAYPTSETTPGLVLAGEADEIAEISLVQRAYSELSARPKTFVSLRDAGHLAFSDICAIGRSEGGVLAIAMTAGLEIPNVVARLATDGCRETNLPAEAGWRPINHFVTEHFLAALHSAGEMQSSSVEGCPSDTIAEFRSEL